MKIIGKHATYLYSIDGFKQYSNGYSELKQNPNLIAMSYGAGKSPFVFHKEKAYDLTLAICGKEQLVDENKFTKEKFDEYVEKYGMLKMLTYLLKGRGFVIVTDCYDYSQFGNAIQSSVVGITGMDIDGKLFAEKNDELLEKESSKSR